MTECTLLRLPSLPTHTQTHTESKIQAIKCIHDGIRRTQMY